MKRPKIALLFLGDSDIARWPADLLPSIQGVDAEIITFHQANDGALLSELPDQMVKSFSSMLSTKITFTDIIVISCAGENDLSYFPVDVIIESFQKLIRTIFQTSAQSFRTRFIFLGPKIEPWLCDDIDARILYFRLSHRLKQVCSYTSEEIYYVDCLSMFCDNNIQKPSVLRSDISANQIYFNDDKLHLNLVGYSLWRNVLNDLLSKLLF